MLVSRCFRVPALERWWWLTGPGSGQQLLLYLGGSRTNLTIVPQAEELPRGVWASALLCHLNRPGDHLIFGINWVGF